MSGNWTSVSLIETICVLDIPKLAQQYHPEFSEKVMKHFKWNPCYQGTPTTFAIGHLFWLAFSTEFKLTYRDLGNSIHFLFFTTQFSPTSLKIMIPKHNIKRQKNLSLNVNHREKLCFTEFSNTRIYWNRGLVASGFFFLFTQSNKFYKFHWHMLRKRLFIK